MKRRLLLALVSGVLGLGWILLTSLASHNGGDRVAAILAEPQSPPLAGTVVPVVATQQTAATLTTQSEQREATWIARVQTPLPTRTMLPVQATQRAQATRDVRRWATSVVQTQTAIAPTPLTLRSGHMECPASLIEYTSCWHGVVNNTIVDLGVKNQPAAPALEVVVSQLDQQPISRDTYLLLAGRGFFFIQSVTGTKVTLNSDGNRVSITFDLATRQWSAIVTQPTPTLAVGLSAVYSGQKNSRDALISTRWQGYVNGAATIVYAGRAGIEWGSGNEEPHALLHLGIDLQRTDPAKVKQARTYSSDAPINIGTLGIISVKDLRLMLIGIEPSAPAGRLIFDLTSRWWLPPDVQVSRDLAAGAVECQPDSVPETAQYLYNCWRGRINGEFLGLDAGRQSARSDYNGKAPSPEYDFDCCQGILRVRTYTPNQSLAATTVYSTPQQVGAVYINAIKGTHVTLAPYDPRLKNSRFVFDLTTRRWISPPVQPTTAWNVQPVQCNGTSNIFVPRFVSCWAGIRNGSVVSVRAGGSAATNEPQQGILSIFTGLTFPSYISELIYKTPLQLGPVRIVSIQTGGLITLAPIDPQYVRRTFLFDLNTRQWLAPELGRSHIEAP